MADELKITANFDAAPIIEGAEKVVEAIKSIGDAVNASITPTEGSFKASAAGVDALLTSLGATAEVVKEVGTELTSLPASLDIAQSISKMAISMQEASVGAGKLVQQLTGLNAAEQGSANATGVLDVGLAVLAAASGQLLTSLGATSEALTAVGTQGANAAEEINLAGVEFNLTSNSAAKMEASLSSMLSDLTAVEEDLSTAAQQTTLFGASFANANASANKFDAALASLRSIVLETGAAFDQLISSTSEISSASSLVGQSAGQAAGQVNNLTGAVTNAGSAASQAAQQFVLFADATPTVQIVGVNEALTTATGQLQLFSEAAADSSGQLSLFESVLGGTAAAEEAMAKAQQEAANSAAQYAIKLGEGVVVSKQMAEALNFLGNTESVLTSKSSDVAAAQEVVRKGAEKLNLQLRQTAEGMQLVNIASTETPPKLDRLTSSMAYLGGRSTAMLFGFSQLGFELGILGRSVLALAPIFAGAFVVGLPILVGEAISSLIDKYDKMQEAIRKSVVDFDNMAASAVQAAESTQLENLKLEDQIAKMEGRPVENRLHEALLESTMQAQALSKSLEDAIEKTLELMKTGEVGFFKSLISGKESTSSVKDALEAPFQILQDALLKQREAQVSGNKEQQLLADQQVDNSRADMLRYIDVEKEKTKALMQQKQAQLEAGSKLVTPTGPIVKTALPPAEAAMEVADQFRNVNAQLAEAEILLKSNELQTKEVAKAAELIRKSKEAENAADERSRTKTLSEPGIKAAEATGKQLADIKRKDAEQAFKDSEADIKNQIERAVLGGELRAKAELEIGSKIVAARRTLTKALSDAQEDEYQSEKLASERRAKLISGTEVGPTKNADLETNRAARVRLEEDNAQKQRAIASTLANFLINNDTNTTKQQIDIQKDANTKILREQEARIQGEKAGSAERLHEAQVYLELVKKLYREDSAEYAAARIKMAEEDRRFNENRKRVAAEQIDEQSNIAKNQFDIQRINIETQRDLGLLTARARLESLRDTISQERDAELQWLEEKKAIWGQDSIEYERIQKQIVDTDLSYKKKLAQADADVLKQRLGWYINFNNQIKEGFASSIEAMLRGQKSLLQGTYEMLGNIVVTFARNTALMLADWILKNTLMKLASKALFIETALEHLLGIGKEKTAETANNATKVASSHATNAAIMISDQAVVASHIAGTIAMMNADFAGAGVRTAAILPANIAAVISEAGVAGAAGFASVMLALPFPANVIAAPPVAAAAAGSTLAFVSMAAAAKGAILSSDQPVFAHDREMILPAHISTGLQNVIAKGGLDLNSNVGAGGTPSGGGGNSPTIIHYHAGDVQALDSSGVSAILMRNRKDVTKIIKKALHSGQLNVKGLI